MTRDEAETEDAIADFKTLSAGQPDAALLMAAVRFPNRFERSEVNTVGVDMSAPHYIALADLCLEAALARWPAGETDMRAKVEAARRALEFAPEMQKH